MTLSPQLSVSQTPRSSKFYLSAQKAAEIDEKLMSYPYSHTLIQLMELAGLAVAHAIGDCVEVSKNIFIVCGPGNNGGDGLVAARHLTQFGYSVQVLYPKQPEGEPFVGLKAQVQALDIPVFADLAACESVLQSSDVIVDAIFGFSFSGANGVREPFYSTLRGINEVESADVICVDIPSGWDVDGGDVYDVAVHRPAGVVSLTAPKICMKEYKGVHYIGGRFVPKRLCNEIQFEVPRYEGCSGISRIS